MPHDSCSAPLSVEAVPVSLDKLVTALPEIYQPIFGHPELSARVSRESKDRLAHITHVYQILAAKIGRPLRVLDLGCAQGFFSFHLAELGATVHGVDFDESNIAVCNALASEHPELRVRFQRELIEHILSHLQHDHYDLVLGLSVFHHIVHRLGTELVQKMLIVLAHKTVAGIFEMALASEPVHWAPSQPHNSRQLLIRYAFVHELAQNATHLSAVNRPLYFASNRYWLLNGQAEAFDTWKTESHAYTNNSARGTRRYYFGNGVIAKLFTLDVKECRDSNLYEHTNEVRLLSTPPTSLKVPLLLLHGKNECEAWLVREQLPGELLLDKIRSKKPYDPSLILCDILEQLIILEAAGLYHEDLRTWNVLIGLDGHATLIDYGAVAETAKDCVWPNNIFLSFMIFVREVISGNVPNSYFIRQPSFNPEGFPEPYRSVFRKLYAAAPDTWSFAFLQDLFLQARQKGLNPCASTEKGFALAIQAMENACSIYQGQISRWIATQVHSR